MDKIKNKSHLLRLDFTCDEVVEVYRTDDNSLVFIPLHYTVEAIDKAYSIASKYAMDIWLEGNCESFGLYFIDRVEGIDTPHVYVKLFNKKDKEIS